jgi:hypothetical protein
VEHTRHEEEALKGLEEKGFGHEQLVEMQKIINAEKSDLFDVLEYVAYALPALTREERAARAKVAISAHFNNKQQAFLDFVLSLRPSRRRGVGSREAHAPIAAQASQLHHRRASRLGTSGRDRDCIRDLPEVPVSASSHRLTNRNRRSAAESNARRDITWTSSRAAVPIEPRCTNLASKGGTHNKKECGTFSSAAHWLNRLRHDNGHVRRDACRAARSRHDRGVRSSRGSGGVHNRRIPASATDNTRNRDEEQ